MSTRYKYPVQGHHERQTDVVGSFAPNGSSAVDADSRKGRGWSVARTDVGEFTITLAEKYDTLIADLVSIRLASPGNTIVQTGPYDSSAGTIVIQVLTAGVAADVSANANNKISFKLVFQDSSVRPVAG